MAKYRKKPIEVDAIKYDGTSRSIQEIQSMAYSSNRVVEWKKNKLLIHTDEGIMECKKGSYVIKGTEGEIYPCRESVFKATYEEVSA